jgi:hypothetical protein
MYINIKYSIGVYHFVYFYRLARLDSMSSSESPDLAGADSSNLVVILLP